MFFFCMLLDNSIPPRYIFDVACFIMKVPKSHCDNVLGNNSDKNQELQTFYPKSFLC